MRVLVACEFSGIVRRAFRALGHDAWSCDLLESEDYPRRQRVDENFPHITGDVRRHLERSPKTHSWTSDIGLYQTGGGEPWDLMIAHPPCTHLAVSGARWFGSKRREQAEALDFVRTLLDAPIPYIALENPISIISSHIRKPDQIIQPHMFGHPEFKATCLWLKNLPPLVPTEQLTVPERGSDEWKSWNRVHRLPPGPDRWKERSRTFTGIAEAMAVQWGAYVEQQMRKAA